jgi:hypothetical protein
VTIPRQYYEKDSIGAKHETLIAGTKNRRRQKQISLLRPQRHVQVVPADRSELPDNPLPFQFRNFRGEILEEYWKTKAEKAIIIEDDSTIN